MLVLKNFHVKIESLIDFVLRNCWIYLENKTIYKKGLFFIISKINNPWSRFVMVLTLKKPGRGWINPCHSLNICHFELDSLRSIKPSCNFHSWYMKTLENMNKWVIHKRNFKYFHLNLFFFSKVKWKILKIQSSSKQG